MRTVHGQYRRKVKIPKEEVFGGLAKDNETTSETTEVSSPTSTRPSAAVVKVEKKSPHKRKSTSPLKVKLPFKMASAKTKDQHQQVDSSEEI